MFELVGSNVAPTNSTYSFTVKWSGISFFIGGELVLRWKINNKPREDVHLAWLLPNIPNAGEKTISINTDGPGDMIIEAKPCIKYGLIGEHCGDTKTLHVRVIDESMMATITVTSDAEAIAYVDGNEIGRVPATTKVEAGEHVITVKGEDCTGKKTIEVGPGETKAVNVPCKKEMGTLDKISIVVISLVGLIAAVKVAEVMRE